MVALYLRHLHERNRHVGHEGTIAEAREVVWILAIRQALRAVISTCQVCRIQRVNPERPTIGPLHATRVAFDQKPFSYVGVDCFGPILVRERRNEVKRWGVIFTCLTFRAIHLEVVNDLSSNQILLALRRLIARRGPLKKLFSDNGTNFVGAARVLQTEAREAQQCLGEDTAQTLRVPWSFIPAYSPWMGGAWERLIGYVKRCINFTLRGETPTDDVLTNWLIEAELLANKRPLTHTPVDPDDEEPLTPNLALFGSSHLAQAEAMPEDANQFARFSRKRVTHLTLKFQKRWEREFLPTIVRNDQGRKPQRNVELGDVVMVTEGEVDRRRWKLGRITRIHPTGDGVTRIVDVKLGNGEVKHKRAVGNLAVLELN